MFTLRDLDLSCVRRANELLRSYQVHVTAVLLAGLVVSTAIMILTWMHNRVDIQAALLQKSSLESETGANLLGSISEPGNLTKKGKIE